ncbi:MAG: GTPase domain-containing protein [Polyangiaceae bacterium]
MVARVVYDGCGSAGKTTNVRRLASALRGVASWELEAPLELAGRTLYFDWVTIRAGEVCGFPLLCEVVTVPGQAELAQRRARILEGADVVVHVCDARVEAVTETRASLGSMRDALGASGASVVLQANKQDASSALVGPDLALALGEGGPVIEAIASEGIGVVDTFLVAVRELMERVEGEGLDPRVPVGGSGGAGELFDALEALEVDRAWLAELALEAAAAELDAEARRARAPGSRVASEGALEARASVAPPLLPGPGIPAGHVWPALRGRSVLAELSASAAYAEARASADTPLTIDGWELWTSAELRFDDAERARASLVRRAREHARIQRATEGDAILVLERAGDDALWLWTLRPRGGVDGVRA